MLATLEAVNRTIPAPHNTVCGHNTACQRIVAPTDLEIVRYNNRIFHKLCFADWFEKRVQRRRCAACKKGQCNNHKVTYSNNKNATIVCLCPHHG